MGPKVRGSTGFCLNGYKVTISDSKMIAGAEEKWGVTIWDPKDVGLFHKRAWNP